MLSSLQTLMKHGYCVSDLAFCFVILRDIFVPQREMPVFGVVQDQVVTGIIVCVLSSSHTAC